MPHLSVSDLVIGFQTDQAYLRVVNGVSFAIEPEQTLGLVGESGCGKSVTALAIMRLLPQPAGRIESGAIHFQGQDLVSASAATMRTVRGRKIAMIFQEPMTALNPVHKIGRQLAEVYALHFPGMSNTEIKRACVQMLDKVGIPEPEKRLIEYPHQLSGGMRQRVMIAMALACRPQILIADEPTTALDVTTQAQILALMTELQREMGMAILFITHDLGVVAQLCDQVIVMYAGRVAEQASRNDLFQQPRHPYTRGLLHSIPRLTTPSKQALQAIPGVVPDIQAMPSGCRFRDRCEYAQPPCADTEPELIAVADQADPQRVACLRWQDIA